MPTLHKLIFRPYTSGDQNACLLIFDSNVPLCLAADERGEFTRFLDQMAHPYYVVEDGPKNIIACGGTSIKHLPDYARLRWGMVKKEGQCQGVGRFLLIARLNRLCEQGHVGKVRIDTSQHTFGFYEKAGFITQAIVSNGIAPGLDAYQMELELTHTKKADIVS